MLQLLQYQNSGPFAHDKSVSFPVKRNGTAFGVCRYRQGGQGGKTCHTHRGNAGFCAACYHYFRVSGLYTPIRFADTVGAGCTGCHHIQTFAFQSELNGHITCRHVGNHHGHHKGIHTIGPFFQKLLVFPFYCLQTSNAGPNGTAHPVSIFLFHIKPRLFQRFFCCCHRILAEKFHTLCRLKIHIFFSLKAFHFGCQMYFICTAVKLCDFTKGCVPFF